MTSAKKIALTNLAELRTALGLNQTELSNSIKPMVRQTLASIENKERKDSEFIQAVFGRLKDTYGEQFEIFELEEEPGTPDLYRINYSRTSAVRSRSIKDMTGEEIRELTLRIRESIEGDMSFIHHNDRLLKDLARALLPVYARESDGRETMN